MTMEFPVPLKNGDLDVGRGHNIPFSDGETQVAKHWVVKPILDKKINKRSL